MEALVIELISIDDVVAKYASHSDLPIILNLWVAHTLNLELARSNCDYRIVLIKLNYFGEYPALGAAFKGEVSDIEADKVAEMGNSLVNNASLLDVLKFAASERDYVLAEITQYNNPNWVVPFPKF